ncbi:MAG: pyridoxamine 5'-phosphate oxidase family protein [Rhizonema sp. PD38]|nr:pyridoxamine 5'-phosphate oxidase family protein [Rhizonema sp. PD38]
MRLENPFHEGELWVQQRVGEAIAAQQNGQIIADTIPKGALKFIEQQRMVVLGSVDAQRRVWASVLFGLPGFVKPVDPQAIEFDLTQAILNPYDLFWTNIQTDSRIGMLVIELATRRRLRINGMIAQPTSDRLHLTVLESYPNCPKYIQRRQVFNFDPPVVKPQAQPQVGQTLTFEQQQGIASADTLFVASAHPTRGVDASHRGGNPGFVQILDQRSLRIPDYAGNSMFNTLGNLVINPQAGLVFLDFDRSRMVQLTGQATIQWHLDNVTDATGGTSRYWDFGIEQWFETDLPQSFHWEFLDYSSHNLI